MTIPHVTLGHTHRNIPTGLPNDRTRDLLIATHSACVNEGSQNAEAGIGVAFGHAEYRHLNAGHVISEALQQDDLTASWVAISHALALAPRGYDLYLVVGNPACCHSLRVLLYELRMEQSKRNASFCAYPPSLLTAEYVQASHYEVMRDVFEGIYAKERENCSVTVMDDEGVWWYRQLLAKATRLARVALAEAAQAHKDAEELATSTQDGCVLEEGEIDPKD